VAEWRLACPQCRSALEPIAPGQLRCPIEATVFELKDGIWGLLAPDRHTVLRRFMDQYAAIRHAEGWGSDDAAYYRALPFEDRSGLHADVWRQRARQYRRLIEWVLKPIERQADRPLRMLDVGAGNGWLAYRLAQRGHHVAAIDLMTNIRDGLSAHRYYDAAFLPVQAEFDHLPFEAGQADVVVYNGAFHYSTNYATTLREAWRVLTPTGCVIVLDSPVYYDAASGEALASERQVEFQRRYGLTTDALAHENFLTPQRLHALAIELGLMWRLHQRWQGWPARLRAWRARAAGQRELAHMPLIVGRRA